MIYQNTEQHKEELLFDGIHYKNKAEQFQQHLNAKKLINLRSAPNEENYLVILKEILDDKQEIKRLDIALDIKKKLFGNLDILEAIQNCLMNGNYTTHKKNVRVFLANQKQYALIKTDKGGKLKIKNETEQTWEKTLPSYKIETIYVGSKSHHKSTKIMIYDKAKEQDTKIEGEKVRFELSIFNDTEKSKKYLRYTFDSSNPKAAMAFRTDFANELEFLIKFRARNEYNLENKYQADLAKFWQIILSRLRDPHIEIPILDLKSTSLAWTGINERALSAGEQEKLKIAPNNIKNTF